jgi:hypothetical protein
MPLRQREKIQKLLRPSRVSATVKCQTQLQTGYFKSPREYLEAERVAEDHVL